MPEAISSGAALRRMPAPASLRVLVLDDSRVDRRRIERLCREADIEVELVDRLVGQEVVDGQQRADLVDAAGDAAAAEDQRHPPA